jgi:hypothetical protein
MEGFPPSGTWQAQLSMLRAARSASGEELSPPFHFGDTVRSALMLSILDKTFKGEL